MNSREKQAMLCKLFVCYFASRTAKNLGLEKSEEVFCRTALMT